jgi:hypothetical protein
MLTGSREGILRRVQPISIHGQLSLDVFYSYADDADGAVHVARVGPEAVPHRLDEGDRVRLDYVLGQVIAVTRLGQTP